ncbi:MAG TPA: transcriptional regulator GcvA [Kofleriaceae bacterium]|nr:transcriptional regulator GcvA [Kofleriaceae bacterium]
MADKLPSLNALRAFEAAGRHLSFTRAAEELFITQGAVSRHIRGLEDELGVELFTRKTRALELTPAGAAYLATVRQAFDLLLDATRALDARRRTLTVSLLASFAVNWLVPRLGRFAARHPEIELALEPTTRPVDLLTEHVDVAIRYGSGGWPGLDSTKLLDEELFPVCSPAFLAAHPIVAPRDVVALPLLHSSSELDWQLWLARVRLDLAAAARQRKLHDYNIVLQAAIAGQGVAIGRRFLVEERLADGSLVRPLADSVADQVGYYMLTAPGRRDDPSIAKLRTWLVAEARMSADHASPAKT